MSSPSSSQPFTLYDISCSSLPVKLFGDPTREQQIESRLVSVISSQLVNLNFSGSKVRPAKDETGAALQTVFVTADVEFLSKHSVEVFPGQEAPEGEPEGDAKPGRDPAQDQDAKPDAIIEQQRLDTWRFSAKLFDIDPTSPGNWGEVNPTLEREPRWRITEMLKSQIQDKRLE